MLLGDYNPGGKLPVTFPKSLGQIELNFPFKPASHAKHPSTEPGEFEVMLGSSSEDIRLKDRFLIKHP